MAASRSDRPLSEEERSYVDAAREKAFILYEGRRVPHRSCGIALAETFGLPTPAYQSLRRGGITGEGACGAIRAGEQVLGELLGDPDPTGQVTPELREALNEAAVLSYRPLLFEKDAAGEFLPPLAYPREALTCLSTHDLPTWRGFWDGHDLKLRRELGLTVRRVRQDHGWSQTELADRAGVGRPWLSELERGKPTAQVGRVLAVVRACYTPADGRAEFAIVVPRALSGQGLGSHLMQRIIDWCRGIGAREVWGEVLAENSAMLALAGKLGFTLQRAEDNLVHVRLPLES